MLLFYFFKQKTAYDMRISDWSSDVCSSDLPYGHSVFLALLNSGHNGPPLSASGFLAPMLDDQTLSHLDRLEAESIHILREVAAEFQNPVMMYSVGKDSSVLMHLDRKSVV